MASNSRKSNRFGHLNVGERGEDKNMKNIKYITYKYSLEPTTMGVVKHMYITNVL